MRPRDIVVIFTDGGIFDMDNNETRLAFDRVASKSSVALFLSTQVVFDISRWIVLKIDLLGERK